MTHAPVVLAKPQGHGFNRQIIELAAVSGFGEAPVYG